MPRTYIYETAITIDHEADVMLVDTTVARIAGQLLRVGFQETTEPDARPFRRFRGLPEQIRFLKPKAQRRVVLRGAATMAAASRRGVRRTRKFLRGSRTRLYLSTDNGGCRNLRPGAGNLEVNAGRL